MADDTLDIELSVDDIEKMDAMMIKSIYNKLRQSRADVMAQREELQTELAGMRNKLNHDQMRLSHALARAPRCAYPPLILWRGRGGSKVVAALPSA